MIYTPGIDTSFYQDKDETPAPPDFTKAVGQGSKFSIHRLGQGERPDEDFHMNRSNAQAAGLLVGSYLFWDYRYRMSVQIDLVNAMLGDDRGKIPIALDLERVPYWKNGVQYYVPLPPVQNIYDACDQFIDAIYMKEGRYPILYTNLEWLWYIITKPTPLMLKCRLWVACYNPVPPTKLGGWENWTFWQYTSHGDGRAYGMESGNIDLDWFNGSLEDLRKFCGEPPVIDGRTLEQKVAALMNAAHEHGWVV